MVDLAGVAVGTAFGELFGLVKDVVKTVAAFHDQLKKIESTLSSVEPIIKDIDEYNNMLECPQEMDPIKVILEEGKGLVDLCSRIHTLNLCMKYTHSKDLTAFNVKVMEKFWIYISLVNVKAGKKMEAQMQACRADVKDYGKAVKAVEEKLDTLIRLTPVIQGNYGYMPSVNLAAPTAPDFIVGLEASLRELKKQLLEEGVSMRVVTGPSGCGKTTLLKKLCHDPKIKGKFKNNIMFVPVSKNSNLTDIVQNMIRHMGFMEPTIQTEDVAVLYLQRLLDIIGENPVLLVLDDVSTEWENILEKFVFRNIKDYKIVVTSTYDFPRYHPVHRLNRLTSSEASKLLRRSVFADDNSVDAPYNELLDKLNSCSWQIMKRCNRLPLALTVVAKSLRGKNSSFRKRLALPENSDFLDCLRNVLDYLRQCSIKERFMDLSAFPEDCKIPATALIDMWVELYELDFDGRRAIADLWDLDERNLAELVVPSDDNDSSMGPGYSRCYAMQHDLLRDLAIRECNLGDIEERERLIVELIGNNFPDWWSEQKQQPLCARLVSISTDKNFSTPWPNLELPKAEALVLNFYNDVQSKTYALPAFIEKANKLKALIVMNHSFFRAELENFHVIGSNIRRIRLERLTIPFMSMGNLRLHSLKKISFVMCDISDASTSIDAKISDAMPNLEELDIDDCNNLVTLPEGICEIKPLRKLSITSCHRFSALPERIEKLGSLEVVRLNFCINLSQLPNSIGSLRHLRLFDVRGCQRLTVLPLSIVKLRNLMVVCDDH